MSLGSAGLHELFAAQKEAGMEQRNQGRGCGLLLTSKRVSAGTG
jgi:hypothetical protein